jgi:hypothetical protein
MLAFLPLIFAWWAGAQVLGSVWRGLGFAVACYLVFFPGSLLLMMPGMAIAEGLSALGVYPKEAASPNPEEPMGDDHPAVLARLAIVHARHLWGTISDGFIGGALGAFFLGLPSAAYSC